VLLALTERRRGARFARSGFGGAQQRTTNAAAAVSGQDNQIRDEAVCARIVVGLGRTISRQYRDEPDHDTINVGNEDDALELPTALEHEVQVGVGDLLTWRDPQIEPPLEVLEINEARSQDVAIARRIVVADSQHLPPPNGWPLSWRAQR